MMNSDENPKTSKAVESLIPTATPFILPLFVFLLIVSFYPDFAKSYEDLAFDETGASGVTSETWWYIAMIGVQVVIATGLLVYFRKIYVQHFPIRCSPLSILVGVVGVVLWIGVCQIGLEPRLLSMIGMDHSRPSFNPFTIEDGQVRLLFLGLRFTLLALIVPIIEELFLRGWLVRWVQDPNWENVGLKGLSVAALLTPSIYGVITHPSEALAAFLWFGLVTWLMARTGNLWDCVVAHAVTNLLLGIYVLQFEQWQLW
jgi:CAAX prenyl protease-like protein